MWAWSTQPPKSGLSHSKGGQWLLGSETQARPTCLVKRWEAGILRIQPLWPTWAWKHQSQECDFSLSKKKEVMEVVVGGGVEEEP